MNIQHATDREPQPWRNGRGVQFDITANGSAPDVWTWKLSTADITEDVPFSSFPEVSRQFCVADGNGVELTIDGVAHVCTSGSVTPFRGDADVHARLLDGPMRALNLMTRRGDSARLRVLMAGESLDGGMVAISICGESEITVAGGRIPLRVLDAVLDLGGAEVRVERGRAAILIRD